MIYEYLSTKVHLRWQSIFNLHHNILISSSLITYLFYLKSMMNKYVRALNIQNSYFEQVIKGII